MSESTDFNFGESRKQALPADGWFSHVRAAIVSTIVLTVLLGGVYPLVVWGIGRLPGLRDKADGSLIVDKDGKVRGSRLIGQTFIGKQYFHSRPSAAGSGYDASLSSGTNWGPTNAKLVAGIPDDPATQDVDESVAGVPQLVAAYREMNVLSASDPVPADAVTRSGSGLDPHISVRNAELQAGRVAKERNLPEADIRKLIEEHTEKSDLGILGDAGVNVVTLNFALDGLGAKK